VRGLTAALAVALHEFVHALRSLPPNEPQNAWKLILARIPFAGIPAAEIVFTDVEKNGLLFCGIPLTGTRRKVASMSDLTTSTDFTIAPGVRETASEDGAVLLDIEQGICFSLNPVGLRIWELLKKRRSLDQIADTMGQEFSVSRSQLLSDATEFIKALEGKHLIYRPGQLSPKKSWFSKMLPFCKKRLSAH
jgi:hypothetical protein